PIRQPCATFPPPLPEHDGVTPPPLPRRFLRRYHEPVGHEPVPGVFWVFFHTVYLGIVWGFGFVTLFVGLAVLAALPVLQFLSLGYLLEASGRVARTGRLRDGFVGVRTAARVGGIVLGTFLVSIPLWVVSDWAYDAEIVDGGGKVAQGWRIGLFVLMAITMLHVALAWACGGRLWRFFWPLNFVTLLMRVARGGYYAKCRDGVWDFAVGLRLPYYFWLGLRGFVVAFAWLVVPASLLAVGHADFALAPLVGFGGAVLMGLVLLYLPFLQTRMAAANRLADGFAWWAARMEYRRAPWAYSFAFVITLLFAVPLYLLKIEIVPREAAWLPGLVFIAFIFPARLLTGWAVGRARKREAPRHWFFRWTGRLPFVPVAAFYVIIVFFTQYTSWNGVWSLYEQHAFLVPVPFFGM
ncbi:MAG TPA: hypothetical protein VM597_27615, partial [Gemmataceae bacterium]|nr:hypothetical protein [Gemmataceae bacterium]